MQHMHGSHDISLVVLSFVIAFMASLTALDTARRVSLSSGRQKKLWLLCGSTAMGVGIWAMHFIAMLAFELPIPIHYDVFLVSVSIIVAIAASLWGLSIISTSNVSNLKLLVGGTFMGLGISGMHYIGMAAMKGIHITYNPIYFALSILIAIGASSTALMLAFRFSTSKKGISSKVKLLSGMVMGVAIAGMHYTGMAAATFMPVSLAEVTMAASSLDTQAMVVSVTISAIVILGIVLVISFALDQRLDDEIAFKGAILESVLDCVIIIDRYGNVIECNPAVTRIFGYSREEMMGHSMEKKLLLPSSLTHAETSFTLNATAGEILCNQRLEVIGVRRDDVEFPIELTVTKIKKEGPPMYTVYARDITSIKQSEETIRRMAYQDSLTGLPNRRFFNETLRESLQEAEEHNTEVAVVFLDLDRFKIINDSMGHAFGDLLLKGAAERLQACVDVKHVVARNGGDEFTIILRDTTEQEAEKVVKQVIQYVTQPFNLDGQEIFITTSMGLAMYPKDGLDQETLVKNADTAMYETKGRGRNGFTFYQQGSGLKISKQLQIENELRMALERNEFVVYYQPKFNMESREVNGVEALVRWVHPERGLLLPEEFLPQAEESGLIVPIGRWVLRTAIAQCKQWQTNLFPFQVSVNLSAMQFQQPDIVHQISDILHAEGVNGSSLNLEIMESMMMNVEHAVQVLQDLKKLGVTISIDDFGTGYNSLSSLKNMPIDQIKIDKSFMVNVVEEPENKAIVKAIISIAQSLQVNVIAEGVEDGTQLAFLKKLQCPEMQGYLLSPPITAEEFERLIRTEYQVLLQGKDEVSI